MEMETETRLPWVLLCLRLSVFLVMLMWTLDKFIQPEHAAGVYEKFYFIGGLGNVSIYILGILEMALLIGFVVGFRKRFTYGAVLLLHGVSTLSSFKQYLTPFTGPHLLFFAAWPMLAACFALYYLRSEDKRWVLFKH